MNASRIGKISRSLMYGIAFLIVSAALFASSAWSERVRVVGLLGGAVTFCAGIASLGYYFVKRYEKKQHSSMRTR